MATGDVTYTHKGGEAQAFPFASGSFESDISEIIKVYCGFQPSRIELYLVDADATANTINIWFKGLAEASSVLMSDGGDITYPTTLGAYPLSDATGEGFYVPAGQTGAADDDVTYWVAWR